MTEKTKRPIGEGEQGAILINRLLGNHFAFPVTEIQECPFCDFEGNHTIEHRMVDLDTAIKTYKCTSCGQIWEYTNVDEELLDTDSRE